MTLKQKISPNLPSWIQDHLTRYIDSNGEDGYWWDTSSGGDMQGKVATLLLTTVGRKTGNHLTLPLIFGYHNGNYIVVASKGGAPTHPSWYLNLMASGKASIQVKADKLNVDVQIAEGKELETLWKIMEAIYPPYKDYQMRAKRKIPVVILKPNT